MRSLAWGALFVVHVEGFSLDPGEVTPALLGGHGATDVKEMVEHPFLALDPGVSGFDQEFLDLGGEAVVFGEEASDAVFAVGNALAEFSASRQVSLMKSRYTGEFFGGKFEFELEPGELRLILAEHRAVARGHGPIGGCCGEEAEGGTQDQDDQGTSHGFEIAW
jgi:hypothetical protein